MLHVLLEGASVEALNRAFVAAAEKRRLDVMRMLLERGAIGTTVGSEALLKAVGWEHDHDVTEIVTFLLDLGADINARDASWKASALFCAADRGDLPLVTLLLGRGADVDSVCRCDGYHSARNWTPLQSAAMKGHKAVVEALLAAGANVHLENSLGRTALHYAGSALVRALVSSGADVNARDREGQTPIMMAWSDDMDTVRTLLESGAQIDAKDAQGRTALMHAAWWGRGRCVHALLEAGADVNARSLDGETALILAISIGRSHAGVVRELVQRGASVTVRDESGKTAFDYTEGMPDELKRAEIVRLLQSASGA